MILSLLQITIFYAFLLFLLLVVLIRARLWWQAKAIIIIISSVFFILSYQTVDNLLGRPTTQIPTEEFVYITSVIHKPSVRHKDPGSIHIWVRDSYGYRLHKFPYSEKLRKKIDEAEQKRKRGGHIGMRFNLNRRINQIKDERDFEIMLRQFGPQLPTKNREQNSNQQLQNPAN